MDLGKLTHCVAGTVILASLLSGCGGSAVSPATAPGSALANIPVRHDANHYGNDIMYASQFLNNDLSVYARKGFTITLTQIITQGVSGPEGMMSTVNGWWYVANGGDSNVLIYQTKKKKGPVSEGTLNDYGQDPVNVAVTPDRNLVAVSNLGSASGAGSVGVYLYRSNEPARVLTYGSDLVKGMGVAIDHQGNCYWSFNDPSSGSGSIVEFAGCTGSGTLLVSGIPFAGGLAFDQSGNLYWVNEITNGRYYSGVYECNKTSSCNQLITPPATFGQPTNINFDYKSKDLWVADATGYIDAIEFKGQKTQIYRDPSSDGNPYGVAPEPGE